MRSWFSRIVGPATAVGLIVVAGALPTSAQSQCGSSVRVAQGDTLFSIARRCGTTVLALARANAIGNPNVIYIGQRLRIPDGGFASMEPERGLAAPRGAYRVRAGDTLYRISTRFGVPLSVILRLNPGIDPRSMPIGIVIELPGEGRERDSGERLHRITGVITGEGVECIALRGDDGRLYTLAGNVGDLKPGDRVRVIGRRAEASFCMQGTTIEARRVIALN